MLKFNVAAGNYTCRICKASVAPFIYSPGTVPAVRKFTERIFFGAANFR
jgi:hypothetical protein